MTLRFAKSVQSYGARIIALIVLICSALLLYMIPFVDDIPDYRTIEDTVAEIGDFTKQGDDQATSLDHMDFSGEEMDVFSTDVSLMEGHLFFITFDCTNPSDQDSSLNMDLYVDSQYDLSGQEAVVRVKPGTNSYSAFLPYYRACRPDCCELRFFSYGDKDLTVTNLSVQRQIVVVEKNPIVTVAEGIVLAFFLFALAILIYQAICFLKKPKEERSLKRTRAFSKTDIAIFLSITGIVLTALLIIYRNINITYPMEFGGGDVMGVFYYGRLIDEYGISLIGHRTGGILGAEMYDYPYSDTLSFLLVKLIGIFTDNPYLIINLFYFLCFFLAAYGCAACLRYLQMSPAITVVLSVLYAFSPYIQMRYPHMWLVPYFMMPVACVVAVDIIRDTVHKKTDEEEKHRHFYRSFFLCFCCAFTGLYYAYFACVLVVGAMVIRMINQRGKGIRRCFYPLAYVGATLAGVITNVIPNFLYHRIHGANPVNELALRGKGDVEYYGLKIVQLFLPRSGHRLPALGYLSSEYQTVFPLSNENMTASLGLFGSIGLLIAVFLLFRTNKKEKEISYLTMVCILIGTIGGFASVISVLITLPVRCYNRMSVILMFLGLWQFGLLLEMLRKKAKKTLMVPILAGILVVGILDQTVTPGKQDYSRYESVRDAIREIEASVPAGSYIYELPYGNWPSGLTYCNFVGYIESDDLHWSYGAMQGREEASWQQMVASGDIPSVIRQLREAGYMGLYVDTKLSGEAFGGLFPKEYIPELEELLGEPDVEDQYGRIYFWTI